MIGKKVINALEKWRQHGDYRYQGQWRENMEGKWLQNRGGWMEGRTCKGTKQFWE